MLSRFMLPAAVGYTNIFNCAVQDGNLVVIKPVVNICICRRKNETPEKQHASILLLLPATPIRAVATVAPVLPYHSYL